MPPTEVPGTGHLPLRQLCGNSGVRGEASFKSAPVYRVWATQICEVWTQCPESLWDNCFRSHALRQEPCLISSSVQSLISVVYEPLSFFAPSTRNLPSCTHLLPCVSGSNVISVSASSVQKLLKTSVVHLTNIFCSFPTHQATSQVRDFKAEPTALEFKDLQK